MKVALLSKISPTATGPDASRYRDIRRLCHSSRGAREPMQLTRSSLAKKGRGSSTYSSRDLHEILLIAFATKAALENFRMGRKALRSSHCCGDRCWSARRDSPAWYRCEHSELCGSILTTCHAERAYEAGMLVLDCAAARSGLRTTSQLQCDFQIAETEIGEADAPEEGA